MLVDAPLNHGVSDQLLRGVLKQVRMFLVVLFVLLSIGRAVMILERLWRLIITDINCARIAFMRTFESRVCLQSASSLLLHITLLARLSKVGLTPRHRHLMPTVSVQRSRRPVAKLLLLGLASVSVETWRCLVLVVSLLLRLQWHIQVHATLLVGWWMSKRLDLPRVPTHAAAVGTHLVARWGTR